MFNRSLWVVIGVLLLGITAYADVTPVANCLPFPAQFAGGAGVAAPPVSCPPFTVGGGAVLTGVALTYQADYQFGGAANTVQVTFAPAGPAGVTWAPVSQILNVTGGNSSGAIATGGANATAGISAAAFAAAFDVNVSSAVTQGTVATSSGAVQIVYTYNIPPPPPPPVIGNCINSAANVVFPASGVVPENAFLVRFAANLQIGDGQINLTNTGLNGAPLFGPGFGPPVGNICANVYTFSPDEQLVSCCSCIITPNALANLSVYNDLTANTLTGIRPNSVVVKLVTSLPDGTLAGGLAAWGSTLHPFTPTVPGGLPGVLTGLYYGVETPFTPATLSAAELASITNRCTNIIGNGSTFGLCNACRLGGLGAAKK